MVTAEHSLKTVGLAGAILLTNSNAMASNVYFNENKANTGGAVLLMFHSNLQAEYLYCNQNLAISGSVVSLVMSCTFSCDNCHLYDNTDTNGSAIVTYFYSMINVSNLIYKSHGNFVTNCIFASDYSSLLIYNSTFDMNMRCVSLENNSNLIIVSSSFLNNSIEAIYSHNSTLHISNSVFYDNKAFQGAVSTLELSSVMLNNCTFNDNFNTVLAMSESNISLVNCTFKRNSSPEKSGALYVERFSILNVSHTIFLNNSWLHGGAILARLHCLMVITNCSFFKNIAPFLKGAEGGAIYMLNCELRIFQSRFFKNFANSAGGSVSLHSSSLLINDTKFISNTAGKIGGAITTYNQSSVIIVDSLLLNNNVLYSVMGGGGGLYIFLSSSLIISNVHFFQNEGQHGLTVSSAVSCNITILSSLFMANNGSAIFVADGELLEVNNSQFLNNTASDKGGAISGNSHCIVAVVNTVFNQKQSNYQWRILFY